MKSLLYATRSRFQSVTANSVQSAHMACAFDQRVPAFTAVYRPPATASTPSAHFSIYGLTPPKSIHLLPHLPEWLDWTQAEMAAFRFYLRRRDAGTVVYTRSSRLSWASTSAGLPTFIELHDPLTGVRTAWLKHLLKTQRLPGIVTTTSRLRDDLLVSLPSLSPDRILVAGNAGPVSALEQPALPLPHAGAFNVGYAGSAFRGKGVEIILACASLLPSITFHVIGPDMAACAKLGAIPVNVILHGRLSHPEVIGRLKSMDSLLLPNQRSVIVRSGADIGAHTSPLKLFDYLSTGRPIIASDLPVFHDILRHEQNALLVPAEDARAFCDQLERLRKDPTMQTQLGSNAQNDFAARHTWDQRARRILDFIHSTMNA